jgi:hypothetical protein
MKPIRPLVMIVGLMGIACILASCSKPANPISGDAQAATHESFLVGTLCSSNSEFDCKEAVLRTHWMVGELQLRHTLRDQLRELQGSPVQLEQAKDAARTRQEVLDHVRSALDSAKAACQINDRSGLCEGDAGKAFGLLARAQAGLGS